MEGVAEKLKQLQLFVFDSRSLTVLMVLDATETEARCELMHYLLAHPQLPVYRDWDFRGPAGKVASDIFTIQPDLWT